ncbi:serine protease [Dehalococcoidia bacterium]|nr:serine protease [Dehalococcoidia bacterium]
MAVTPLVPLLSYIEKQSVEVFYRAIPDNLVPSKESLNQLDALEEVVFIGYPSGIWDRENLLPIARKGITATPVAVDFQGIKQFLIDASVFPGSSGSPVFLYNPGMYHDKRGKTVVGTRLLFLGVVASVFYEWEENELRLKESPTAHVPTLLSRQMIDLSIVFKAETVLEAVWAYLNLKGVKTT